MISLSFTFRNMKLTYLDTSNFILLSTQKRINRNDYDNFLMKWKENGLILALSQVHLVELLQAKYPDTRTAHFELLKDFLPFRYEGENFFEREIYAELFKRGFILLQENDKQSSLKLFSNEIKNESEMSALYSAINIISRAGFYKATSYANKTAWKAKSHDSVHKNPKPRLSNLSSNPIRNLAKRIFAWFIGIDSKDKKNLNKPIEKLLEEFNFRTQIKSTITAKFGSIEKVLQKNILSSMKLEDCKGLWLKTEVEKNLKRAGDFDPNNEGDLNHIQYLPYVDILLTDKAIVEATMQVIKSKKLLSSLKSVSQPKKVFKYHCVIGECSFQLNFR